MNRRRNQKTISSCAARGPQPLRVRLAPGEVLRRLWDRYFAAPIGSKAALALSARIRQHGDQYGWAEAWSEPVEEVTL